MPTEQLVAVAEPERARQEHALPWWQPVGSRLARPVAEHEALVKELPLDCLDRAPNARVGCGEEADEGEQQEAGVKLLRAVRLRERAELGIEAAFADVPVNLVADRAPAVDRPLELVLLDGPYRAVERHPRHRLRVDEVAAPTADLPDTVVRLPPRPFEMVEQTELDRPALGVDGQTVLARLIEAVEHLPVDVQLELLARGVADPHRL